MATTPPWLASSWCDGREPTLADPYSRIPQRVAHAVDGLSAEQLAWVPAPGANTIGWLVWRLTRLQDHHVSELLGEEQLYVRDGWAARLGRVADPNDTGRGHSAEEVASVRPPDAATLVGYYEAVHARATRSSSH